MSADPSTPDNLGQRRQSLVTEEFFYFFLRLRKNEVRRITRLVSARHQGEEPRRIARHLIDSKTGLSILGGALLNAPLLMPGVGQALKLTGVVGAGSMLTRMHLYLILEIAEAYGEDIDDTARVPEMVAVVAATGLGAAAPSLLAAYGMQPLLMIPSGALSMTAVTRLVGWSAIQLYERRAAARAAADGLDPEADPGAMPA
jgi:hypothetical protein